MTRKWSNVVSIQRFFLILSVLAAPVFAAAQSQPKSDDWFGYNGQARVLDRWDNDGENTLHTVKGRFRVNGWVKLNESGCAKLNGRIATGDKYNVELFTADLFDGANTFDVNVRDLYLDLSCFQKNMKVEVGVLPTRADGFLGLSPNGWIDGLRVIIADPKNRRSWRLTVGQIDDLNNPNLFTREYRETNFVQAEMDQKLTDQHTLYISVSDYDDSLNARAGVRWALQKYAQWMESVSVEVLFVDGRKMADGIEAAFRQGKWRFLVEYVRINPNTPKQEEIVSSLMSDFYMYGNNFAFEAERSVSKKWAFAFRIREGYGNSWQLEGRVTRHFGKPN